mgnify:CR=1 FL=1
MQNKMRLGMCSLLLGMATLNWTSINGGEPCTSVPSCGPNAYHTGDCCLSCQRVLDRKSIKKTVYSCKLVPYCLAACRNPLARGQTCCETCETHPRWKRVLLKREIVVGETCGTKCEVVCQTHGGANCNVCGQGSGQAGTSVPQPQAYDSEPAPIPAAKP